MFTDKELDAFFRKAYENLNTDACCTLVYELYEGFKIDFSDAVRICNLLCAWNCSEGYYYLGIQYLRVIEGLVTFEIERTEAAGERHREEKKNKSLTDIVEDIICE